MNNSLLLRSALAVLITGLAACSSGPATQPQAQQSYSEPVFSAERVLPDNIDSVDPASAVYDPWEGLNRRTYNFNYHFDRTIFLPAVRLWRDYVPHFARNGVGNFFDNARDARTVFNSLLQLNPEKTAQALGRVMVNTTVGLFGIIDVATDMGLPRPTEDFGQTLGHWGVREGPYLVLPFLGPSNLRDGFGALPDYYVSNVFQEELAGKDLRKVLWLFDAIDTRTEVPFRYYETGLMSEYETMRWLYTTKRKLDVAK